jgi:dTDP-4-dehydrorhamnose reductase
MKILLTGASSYVGARLYLDLSKKYEIIGTYSESKLSDKLIHLDITNLEEIKQIISAQKPDVIIHAAANANTRWCEANPEKAIALNQESTKNIVHGANEIDAKIILISSFAAMDPINVYGKTTLASEDFVKQTKNGYIILRPSLIIGFSPNTTNDRPFNRILKNLDEKKEPLYDMSWKFQPTYLHHIAEVIEKILDKNTTNEIIPVAVKEVKTRYDVAKDILQPFGIIAISENKHDSTPVITDNLEKLEQLNLPHYSYEEMILKIVDEIKNRNFYKFF